MPFVVIDSDPILPPQDPDTGEPVLPSGGSGSTSSSISSGGGSGSRVQKRIEQDKRAALQKAAQLQRAQTKEAEAHWETVKAYRREQNQARLPDYGEVVPGEWRAYGALMYDFWEEGAIEVDSEVVEAAKLALRNEPDLVSSVIGASSAEAAMGILFAAGSGDLSLQATEQLLGQGGTTSGGGKPLYSIVPDLASQQEVSPDNSLRIPLTSSFARSIPSAFLPYLAAFEFGFRAYQDALSDPDRSIPGGIPMLIIQGMIGGYQYGQGISTFVQSNEASVEGRDKPLPEVIKELAAIVTWHETSQNQYGSAANMMYPWAVFNYYDVLGYSASEIIGSPGHWNWYGVGQFIQGHASHVEDFDSAVLAVHDSLMAGFPEYQELYQDVTTSAWLYEQDFPDPTNGGFSILTQPSERIGYPDWAAPAGWVINADLYQQALGNYQRSYTGMLTYNPLQANQNQVLSNPVQLVASFIRIEQSPSTGHGVSFVGWHVLGSQSDASIFRPICIEDSINESVHEACEIEEMQQQ